MSTVANHVGCCVRDLERARRFYVEALGFEEWFAIEPADDMAAPLLRLEPPVGLSAAYLRLGSFVLELLCFSQTPLVDKDERVVNEAGLTHLSLSVDDVDATLAAVRAAGGEVLEDTNIGAAVCVRDPDGQLIELLPMTYRDHLPS